MADRKKGNDKDKDGKDSAPKVPEEKEKGKIEKTSMTEKATEAIKPEADKFIDELITGIMKGPSVVRMLDRMPEETRKTIGKVLPTALGWLIGHIPENLLIDASLTDFMKDSLSRAALTIGVNLREHSKDKPVDEAAIKEAVKKVVEAELVLDRQNQVHVPTCSSLIGRKPFEMKNITLVQAISQGAFLAPCCHPAVENRIVELAKAKAQEAAAKTASAVKKNRSFIEVYMTLNPESRKSCVAWLSGLYKSGQLKRFLEAAPEFDNPEEIAGILDFPKELRPHLLPLVEGKNASYKIRQFLREIGIASGEKSLAQAFKEWDQGLGPKVNELKARLEAPAPKKTFRQRLANFIAGTPPNEPTSEEPCEPEFDAESAKPSINILKLLLLYPAVYLHQASEWTLGQINTLKRQAFCLMILPPVLVASSVLVGSFGHPMAARWLAAIGGLVAALLSCLLIIRSAFLTEVITLASETIGKIKCLKALSVVKPDQAKKLIKDLTNINAWIAGLSVFIMVVPMWSSPILAAIVSGCIIYIIAVKIAGWFQSLLMRRVMTAFVAVTFAGCTLALAFPKLGDAISGLTDRAVTKASVSIDQVLVESSAVSPTNETSSDPNGQIGNADLPPPEAKPVSPAKTGEVTKSGDDAKSISAELDKAFEELDKY